MYVDKMADVEILDLQKIEKMKIEVIMINVAIIDHYDMRKNRNNDMNVQKEHRYQ